MAGGRGPIAPGLLSLSSRAHPSHLRCFVVALVVVVCGCVGDRAPEGAPAAAIPLGVEAVAAQQTDSAGAARSLAFSPIT